MNSIQTHYTIKNSCIIRFISAVLILVLIPVIHGQEKPLISDRIAKLTISPKWLILEPADSFDALDMHFTTYDGKTTSPNIDTYFGRSYLSGELKLIGKQKNIWATDYMNGIEYGSLTFNDPNVDANGNGHPDLAEFGVDIHKTFPAAITQHFPKKDVVNDINITFKRSAYSRWGEYSFTIKTPIGDIEYDGDFWVSGFQSDVYFNNMKNIIRFQMSTMDPSGDERFIDVETKFNVSKKGSLIIPAFEAKQTINEKETEPILFNKIELKWFPDLKIYRGSASVIDGDTVSSWKDLIDFTFEVSAYPNSNTQETLSEAAFSNSIYTLNQHIASGTNLDLISSVSEHVQAGWTALTIAVHYGFFNFAKILLFAGADIEASNLNGTNALRYAAYNGKTEVMEFLIRMGANIEAQGQSGHTPLHMAVLGDELDAAKLLISEGAIINAIDEISNTPLHNAVHYGYIDIIQLLVENGADVNVRNNDNNWTPLHNAVAGGQSEVVIFLIDKGSEINAKSIKEETALHFAALYGHEYITDLLLTEGADIEAKNIDGLTPLHAASSKGALRVFEELWAQGANIEATTTSGRNAFHLAALYGHTEIARFLIRRGIDLNAKDKDGLTAIDLAATENHQNVIDVITEEAKSPTFTLQPKDLIVTIGESAEFTVAATGPGRLNFQWFKDGVQITDATDFIYRIVKVANKDLGVYSVRVKNSYGKSISEIAMLSLPLMPVITAQPKDQYIGKGGVLEFLIEATGTMPLEYQWYKDGKLIGGANKPNYLVLNFQTIDYGVYSVKVSNKAGEIMSELANTLTIGTVLWELQAGNVVSSSPAIGSDRTIYFGSDDKKLYAVNPDGSKKWMFPTSDSVNSSPAIGSDGTVYFGSKGKLYALNANGTKKWEYKGGSNISDNSPAIGYDGTIYYPIGKTIYALDGETGLKKWKRSLGYNKRGHLRSSPVIGSDGTVYIGSHDKKIYAINGHTGAQKWAFVTEGEVCSSPAIGSDGTIYVGSNDNKVYALNAQTGTKKWEFETGGDVDSSAAIGSDGTIYVGSDDNKVYALNGGTGTKKWEFITGGDVSSSAAIGSDGTVYVGSHDDNLYAINPDGSMKWTLKTGGDVWASPTIGSDGTVYVGSRSGKFYSIKSSILAPSNSVWPMFGCNTRRTGMKSGGGAPIIIQQPMSQSAEQGGSAIFKVDVYGIGPFYAQWYINGKRIEGATDTVLKLDNVTKEDQAIYSVKITNDFGIDRSRIAELIVYVYPPTITQQPESKVIYTGEGAEFSVVATGTGALDYLWYKNGKQIEDATGAFLQLESVSKEDEAIYSVRVKNFVGKVASNIVTLKVLDPNPSIIREPKDMILLKGDNGTFEIEVNGKKPMAGLWYKNGIKIGTDLEDNKFRLQINNASETDVGEYYILIQNDHGTIKSKSAQLFLIEKPLITEQPSDKYFKLGKKVNFDVSVTGYGNLQYQWFKDGKPIKSSHYDGYNTPNLSINQMEVNDLGIYSIKVSNELGKTLSKIASLKLSGFNWSLKLKENYQCISMPVFCKNLNYIIYASANIHEGIQNQKAILNAISPAKGEVIWEKTIDLKTYMIDHMICIDENLIFCSFSKFYVIDARTGQLRWETKINPTTYPVRYNTTNVLVGSGHYPTKITQAI